MRSACKRRCIRWRAERGKPRQHPRGSCLLRILGQYYLHCQHPEPRIPRCIRELIIATTRHPMEGIERPAPLRHSLLRSWSRCLTE